MKRNSLVIGLGITYSTGFPIFMAIEKKAKVIYRKNTKFHGFSVKKNNQKFKDFVIHFSRNEKKSFLI